MVLIVTAFLGTTLQARIESTQDLNEDSYLRAIADRIVANAGSPSDWGKSVEVPVNFGLALTQASRTYELDLDKICRLSSQNSNSLSHMELSNAAKLNNIAFGITISQTMTISLQQTNIYTAGADTYTTFVVSTSIESTPAEANLHCSVIAQNYQYNVTVSTMGSGTTEVTVHYPTATADNALLVIFARAPFDDRITSYAIYNLGSGIQETAPNSTTLSLSPLKYTLSFDELSGASVQKVFVLSYSYQQVITSMQGGQFSIPKFIDHSPFVLVACGHIGGQYFEEWTSYPQVPLSAGSSFANSERHIFPYMVTINGVLYKLSVSLGDVNS